MGEDIRHLDGLGGKLRLRPARRTDEVFQFALFGANRGAMLRIAGLPAAAIENLLTMQYRARLSSYRENFPAASWSILEFAGAPIGELIVNDEPDAVYIVDISLVPDRQGQGLGAALVSAIASDSVARGGVRAIAAVGNAPSRKMFARLGFVETPCGDDANVELRWRPPPPAPP